MGSVQIRAAALLGLLLTAHITTGQNITVGWFSVNGGFSASTGSHMAALSVLGQIVVGTTRDAGTVAVSGFLARPDLLGIPVDVRPHYILPEVFSLRQNFPNPFNPTTTITFSLPSATIVTLRIYNILGQEVATLLDHQAIPPGVHRVMFDAGSCASGVYLYRLFSPHFAGTRRMVLLK